MLTVLKETDYYDFQKGDTFICKEPWRYRSNAPKRNRRYLTSQVMEYCKYNDEYDRVDWDSGDFMMGVDLARLGWYNYIQLSDEDHGFEETFELSDGTRVVAFGFVEGI